MTATTLISSLENKSHGVRGKIKPFTLPASACLASDPPGSPLFPTLEDTHTHLLSELLFTQLVQREELSGQRDVLQEATRGQLHPDDDLSVGHHHGHVAELDLEVLRQGLAAVVAQVLVRQRPGRRVREAEAMARVKGGRSGE